MFDENLQTLVKLSQSLETNTDVNHEINIHLQICFDKLQQIQEHLPLILKRNKIILGFLHKFEDGLPKCYQWLTDAKQLINNYSIQVSVKRVEEFLDKHRVRLIDFCLIFLVISFILN